MADIAFLISSNMTPGAPDARADQFELVSQYGALAPACAARGLRLEQVVWDAPGAHWSRFRAAVIAATWDYWDKAAAFGPALAAIERAVPLFNPHRVVMWNLDKVYLKGLAEAGVPFPPTVWAERADQDAIAAAFDVLGAGRVVVKPRVGAGALRLAQVARGAPPPPEALPAGPCLIQPFLESVVTRGEISLLFYGGVFSHGVLKRPAKGDFRVQSVYGGREAEYEPSTAELAAADAALSAAAAATGVEPFLYARVDLADGPDGRPVLMELELIEPYHYPEQGPGCGERFAVALECALA